MEGFWACILKSRTSIQFILHGWNQGGCRLNAYDLKFLSDNDINYNPTLGTGQIQV